MVIFVNDPKRTVIDLSVPMGIGGILEAYLKDLGLRFGAASDKERRFFLDIQGSPLQMSALLKNLEESEWDRPDKVYILIKARKKGGKGHEHDYKDRGEIRKGREGGDREGADPDPGHGEADRVGGADDPNRDPGFEFDPWPAEDPGTDDDCD